MCPFIFEANLEINWTGGNFQQRQNFKVKRMEKINFTAATIISSSKTTEGLCIAVSMMWLYFSL